MSELTFNDTVSKLSSITDPALFERLATAVLRSAKPEYYENLSHPGVNTSGKTVKSPFDGIGWISIDDGGMLIGAEHTTTDRDKLEGKWLHDPSTVKARRTGGKPTQPTGDLVKAIKEIKNLRESLPNLKARIALTCNCDDPSDVRVKVQTLAAENNVELDIWSVSRIAQYLDINSEGQVIRYQYLGSKITHLSKTELLRVGKESLSNHYTFLRKDEVITRNFPDVVDDKGNVLLVGASGMGKTTICLSVLASALERNQPCLVISDQTISVATSLEDALSIELRHYSHSLLADSGLKAIEFGSEMFPLIILIEDVNKSVSPERLLNKVIAWISQSSSRSGGVRWRILCPVWLQHFELLDKKIRDEAYRLGIIKMVGLYTEEEATRAVKTRLKNLDSNISELSIAMLAKSLGNDPLLIGIYDFGKTTPITNVLVDFVREELNRIASSSKFSLTDIEESVNLLLLRMLENKSLNPSWREVKTWSDNGEWLDVLRIVFKSRSLFSLSKTPKEEVIKARHDRILYHLLANVVSESFSMAKDAAYLSEPFFAEIIGMASVIGNISFDHLMAIMEENPVAAFYALKYTVAIDRDYSVVVSKVIESWLSLELHRRPSYFSKRHAGLTVLAEVDSDLVSHLTPHFPDTDKIHSYLKARFRNGDIAAGCLWVTEYDFDITFPDHPMLIEYVHEKYGDRFLDALKKLLTQSELPDRLIKGALIISGYVADLNLLDSIKKAWELYGENRNTLEVFFWASAQVCDDAGLVIAPILDAWEKLSDEEDKYGGSELNNFAAHGVSWKFQSHVPKKAIPHIVKKAHISKKLEWPITYMLRGVDDPVAVQYEVEYLASKRRKSKDGVIFFDHFLKDEWRRYCDDTGRHMSSESKKCLLDISSNEVNDKYLREESFKLWEISIDSDDLEVLKAIDEQDVRCSHAIWARARRQDKTIVSLLIEKIKENPGYWWQAGRYILTEEMTQFLAETIKKVADDNKREESWILPELLSKLNPSKVEELLISCWEKLRTIPEFVQIALYTATPNLISLARKSIQDSDNPKSLFEHYSLNVGIRTKGREGITRLEQLDAIQPYFDLLSDGDLYFLWEESRKWGWTDYVARYLEPVIEGRDSEFIGRVFKKSSINTSCLDKDLEKGGRINLYHWVDMEKRQGWTRNEIFSALMIWFEKNKGIPALKVAGAVVSDSGGRSEYATLEKAASGLQGACEVLDQIRFEVYSRTLM